MKPSKFCKIGLYLFVIIVPLGASALTIVECVDSDGNSSFRDSCPPGTTLKGKKKLRGAAPPQVAPSIAEIAAENPVTVFVAPNCNACDLVRGLLEAREVPFAVKDAAGDPVVQAELSEVTGGALTVPTITVGSEKFSGYHKSELDTALSRVGYP